MKNNLDFLDYDKDKLSLLDQETILKDFDILFKYIIDNYENLSDEKNLYMLNKILDFSSNLPYLEYVILMLYVCNIRIIIMSTHGKPIDPLEEMLKTKFKYIADRLFKTITDEQHKFYNIASKYLGDEELNDMVKERVKVFIND